MTRTNSTEDVKSWLRDVVAPEIQGILEDRPENYPRFTSTDEYAAFLVWLAKSYIPGRFDDLMFADGSKDGGIDICKVINSETAITFSVYQISAPRFDLLAQGNIRQVADKLEQDLNTLHNAITGRARRRTFNEIAASVLGKINEAIEEAQEDPQAPRVRIHVIPVTLARPSADKLADFKAQSEERQRTWSDQNLIWEIDEPFTIDKLLDLYEKPAQVGPDELNLSTPQGLASASQARGPYLAFLSAMDLLDAYERHRSALFDSNLRFELRRKTDVNAQIQDQLSTRTGIKRFHEKNNGIVLACTSLTVKRSGSRIQLRKPQVINGAQTISTIFAEWKRLRAIPLPAREEQDKQRLEGIESDLLLPAKIVVELDPAETDRIAVASNTQNPLSDRTLRSSTREMRHLQKVMAKAQPHPWFLEAKDGEWAAVRDSNPLMQSRTGGKIARHFQWGTKSQVRKMDNKDLGVALLAFYGAPEDSKPSNVFQDRFFSSLFSQRVRDGSWGELAKKAYQWTRRPTEAFEEGGPASSQCILAYSLLEYWTEWTYPERRQLDLAFEEHAKSNPEFSQYKDQETWNVPDEQVTQVKSNQDSCYWTERVAKSAYKALVFESMRLLYRVYGDLTHGRCEAILRLPQFCELAEGRPAKQLGDFRERPLADGPLTASARILHLACRYLRATHDEVATIQSPQQALLTDKWTSRLAEQVQIASTRVLSAEFREARGLEETPTGDAKSLAELFPRIQ